MSRVKKKKYKVKYPNQPVWTCFSKMLRLLYKRPDIICETEDLPTKAIYVANHSAMSGPVVYNLYFPVPHSPWGAYPMLGNYKSRFHYLRDVYFVQKRGMNKAFASFLSSFEACFSIWIYKGMHVLPSYPDGRLLKTLRMSIDALNDGRAVMIFPEHSETGYHEQLRGFSAGFVLLAERYRKIFGKDIPICPIYYHKKSAKMIVGKPHLLQEFRNLTRQQIADEFCKMTNRLYEKYIKLKGPNNQTEAVETDDTAQPTD